MLAHDSAQPLRLGREREIAIEVRRELFARNAGLAQPPCQLLSERIRQSFRRDEQRLNRSAIFGGPSDVPNAFDQIKAGARAAVWGLQRPQALEPWVVRVTD